MINDKISDKQVINIMILFILGSSLVTGGCKEAKQDSWFSLLFAMLMVMPVILMYARINKLAPNQNLFELFYQAFGKIGGAITTIIFSGYTIFLGALVIRNFTEYIQVVALPETPQIISAIWIGIVAYFTIKIGLEVLGRGNVFVFPIVVFIIILTTLLSIKDIDINNLKPVLSQNIKTIFSCSFTMFTFPFAETVLFISVLPAVKTKTKPFVLYLIPVLIAGFLLLILMLRNIMVLGFPITESLYFPSYSAVGIIEIGNFLSRIEVLVSANYIILGLVKTTICLYVSCKGVAQLFNIGNFKKLALPITIVMVIVSSIVFENTMQMFNFIEVYKYYAPFFEVVLPLAVLIVLEIKIRKNKLTFETSQQISKIQ